MIKIFGSPLCLDCVALKASLDLGNIQYEYIDITASMINLKQFLLLRDNNKIYDNIKKDNKVGIPTILDDNEIILDYKNWLKENNIGVIDSVRSCSIDGKNC